MSKPNHCGHCGRHIDGKKYNPYNVTFESYEREADDKKLCLTCAEKFVARANKNKGGHWELREWS